MPEKPLREKPVYPREKRASHDPSIILTTQKMARRAGAIVTSAFTFKKCPAWDPALDPFRCL